MIASIQLFYYNSFIIVVVLSVIIVVSHSLCVRPRIFFLMTVYCRSRDMQ